MKKVAFIYVSDTAKVFHVSALKPYAIYCFFHLISIEFFSLKINHFSIVVNKKYRIIKTIGLQYLHVYDNKQPAGEITYTPNDVTL